MSTGIIPGEWKVERSFPSSNPATLASELSTDFFDQPTLQTHRVCPLLLLDSYSFFHHFQHGFRKGLFCETQHAFFMHDLHANLDMNVQTVALFLDLAKAFDKVPHESFTLKLSSQMY